MKRFLSWVCAAALLLGCVGYVPPAQAAVTPVTDAAAAGLVFNHYADTSGHWNATDHGSYGQWRPQYRTVDGTLHDFAVSNWDTQWNCMGLGSPSYVTAEAYNVVDDIRAAGSKQYAGSGYTFTAPRTGTVTVSFPAFTHGSTNYAAGATYRNNNTSRGDATIVIYRNGEDVGADIPNFANKGAGGNNPIDDVTDIWLNAGDELAIMFQYKGAGDGGVVFDPQVTYTSLQAAYDADDRAVLPAEVDASVKVEGEHLDMHPVTADNDHVHVADDNARSNRSYVAGFATGDELWLYYTAASAGTYALTVNYKAGGEKDLGWAGDTVAAYTGTVPAGGDAASFGTVEYTFEVTQAGDGLVKFSAGSRGGPDIDYMTFTRLPTEEHREDTLTYYVSLEGRGGNDGLSEDSPLPGLDAVPWDTLQAGDRVLLKAGETFPGAIRLVGLSGTRSQPIVIGSYGTGEAPKLDAKGQGIWLKSGGTYASATVLLYECENVKLSGLDVANRNVWTKTALHTAVQGNIAGDVEMERAGIAAQGSTGLTLENVTVHDATADLSGLNAVYTQGADEAWTAPVGDGEARTYYVDSTSGSDSNDGLSESSPFYSLHRINELRLDAGDKVYLKRGSVFENQYLHLTDESGTADAPIVIDAYGEGERPVIHTNGNGVWYQNYGRTLDNGNHLWHGYVSSCVALYDAEYVEVKNLAMTNCGTYGATATTDGTDNVDAGTVPGETGYSSSAAVGSYTWGYKMSRTGVSAVTQNIGVCEHVYLQNLDIENIYGNVYVKHMNNGGIYFTVAKANDKAATGAPKFDDVRIEGNYLKRTSRWGIAAAYSVESLEHRGLANGAREIPDATAREFGQTNLYIGHNYLEEVGGDPITTMYAFKPVVEYNVSTRGAREISGHYHNGTTFGNNNRGSVAAGIWPWKCKTAIFQYNECYDMMNSDNGNGDGQAWDADSGDTTIYQFNYSAGNSGGTVMFCAGEAYNSVFRYNISYLDGTTPAESRNGTAAGILDMAGNHNGKVYNNTFVMKQDVRAHYRSNGPVQVENNIFVNAGAAAYDPRWTALTAATFDTNLYSGFGSNTGGDAHAVTADKGDIFSDPTFAGAPEAPKTSSTAGTGAVTTDGGAGIRTWSHDWQTDFNMFKIIGGGAAAGAGKAIDYTGLNQDSSFGAAQVPVTTDFYGADLGDVLDLGAHSAGVAAGPQEVHYTDADPFRMPEQVGDTVRAEAERLILLNGQEEMPAPETVEVLEAYTTDIGGRVTWSAVPGADHYEVVVTGHGANAGNVWEVNNTGRYARLVNLTPGAEYTVSVRAVSADGRTSLGARVSFTTHKTTNAAAQAALADPEAPDPYGALPSDLQLGYHADELAAFIHFGPNTFTGRSWGTGANSERDAFAPTDLDYDAVCGWVTELKDAGFKRLILVAKHHDGLCLWDSQYTEHDIMSTPWGIAHRDDPAYCNGDLLALVSKACTELGMDMGFYFSPWDQNAPSYGYTDAAGNAVPKEEDVDDYNEYYVNQLREVLGNPKYGRNGRFVETWMDGAKAQGRAAQEYDFDEYFKVIRELQPTCLIYCDRGDGGIRWSGNEVGKTGDPCWQTMNVGVATLEGEETPNALMPNKTPQYPRMHGQEDGAVWAVCECDVSIESEWFWHQGNTVRSMDSLMEMYFQSVGYGSPLLLNMPPNQAGHFDADASARLAQLGQAIQGTLRTDLAQGEGVTIATTQGSERQSATPGRFGAANLIDGDAATYWTTPDGQTTGQVTITFPRATTFDVVSIQEYIELGQRVKKGKVEYLGQDGQWHPFGSSAATNSAGNAALNANPAGIFDTVGARRLIRSGAVTATALRVTITDCKDVPVLRSIGVFKAVPGAEIPPETPADLIYVNDDSSSITYTGSWTQRTGADFIDGLQKYSSSAGATAALTFTGSQVFVMGIKDGGNGSFQVKIDDGAWTDVSTAVSPRTLKTVLWASPNLTAGEHTVTIKVTSGWVDFDGFCYLPAGKSMVQFENKAYSTAAGGSVTVNILRSGDTSKAISFKLNDLPGTAVQGQYYDPVQETITMAAGVNQATATVTTKAGAPAPSQFYLLLSEGSEDVAFGFNAEATVNLTAASSTSAADRSVSLMSAPAEAPAAQEEGGEEAEPMAIGDRASIKEDSAQSGGKYVGDFTMADVLVLPYVAPNAGTYKMTVRYRSAAATSLSWRGDNVERQRLDLPASANFTTVETELAVTGQGAGTLEFYTTASAGPDLDYLQFSLTEVVSSTNGLRDLRVSAGTLTPAFDPEVTAYTASVEADVGSITVVPECAPGFSATVNGRSAPATVELSAGANTIRVVVTAADGEAVTYTLTVTRAGSGNGGGTGAPAAPGTRPGTSTATDPATGATTETVRDSDGTVTTTTTDPSGKVVERVEDPEGNVTITVTNEYGEEDAQVVIPAQIPTPETGFVDVPADHWAAEAIGVMAGLGVVQGVGGNNYDMTGLMTRGTLTTVLYRLSNGKPNNGVTSFLDVNNGAWYAESISWAATRGVVRGYTPETFAPNDTITREQLAVMLARYAQLIGLDTAADPGALAEYTDGSATGSWATEGVAWCLEQGIVQGKGNGRLDPSANVTRAEVALMLQRFIELL